MRHRFFILDKEDVIGEEQLTSSPGLRFEKELPCEAAIYSYSDPELDKLSDFLKKDRAAYMKLLSEDSVFKEKARHINGKAHILFSLVNSKRPAKKLYTYSYQFEAFEIEYRSFKKYEPNISFIEQSTTELAVDSKVNRPSLALLVEWFNGLRWTFEVQNAGTRFLFKEPFQHLQFAMALACLVKSKVKEPICFSGHFGAVLWPPNATSAPPIPRPA